jgi:hypothetical protein
MHVRPTSGMDARVLFSRCLRLAAGNFAAQILPRKQTLKVFCTDEYQKKSLHNDEADAAVR